MWFFSCQMLHYGRHLTHPNLSAKTSWNKWLTLWGLIILALCRWLHNVTVWIDFSRHSIIKTNTHRATHRLIKKLDLYALIPQRHLRVEGLWKVNIEWTKLLKRPYLTFPKTSFTKLCFKIFKIMQKSSHCNEIEPIKLNIYCHFFKYPCPKHWILLPCRKATCVCVEELASSKSQEKRNNSTLTLLCDFTHHVNWQCHDCSYYS